MAQDDLRIEPEPEPRRTKGRKAKLASEEKEISEAALIGLLSTAFVAGFSAAAMTRGAHWNLQQQEATNLGKLSKKWLDSLPGGVYALVEKYAAIVLPSVSLIVGLGATIGPRLEWDRKLHVPQAAHTGAGDGPAQANGRDPHINSGFASGPANFDEFLGAGYR